jgi:hypothetical protein
MVMYILHCSTARKILYSDTYSTSHFHKQLHIQLSLALHSTPINSTDQIIMTEMTTASWSPLSAKLTNFRLVCHDGDTFQLGPFTDLLVRSTDAADTVACRVLKVFQMPGQTHALMHFTAPEPAGKRIVPNYYGIHTHVEVYVHVRAVVRPDLEIVCAGMKRMGLMEEEDVMHDMKRLCIEGDMEK